MTAHAASSPRSALVATMIAVVAEQGFEGLTVRAVAARAGVSPGSVQHHFPSKSAMLDAALDAIAQAAAARGGELEAIADPSQRLHALVDLLVPDGADHAATRVWLAVAARAGIDPSTQESYRRLWASLRDQVRLLIAAASGRLEGAQEVSAELIALVDGLALSVVAEGQEPEAARRLVHRRVDALIAPTS
ncbi:TetR/AcrR family transcriptional regulator [Brachybacterium massiliense]|uniref:TetR/AcrR family transcriptional regulator n=1 Tax=Brachybacterium massiliense TaxID=1755098 RepID=UPI000B3BAD4E|nr:TetR/AcrR family transcriptional regulator [Brachybacterium massiliense]